MNRIQNFKPFQNAVNSLIEAVFKSKFRRVTISKPYSFCYSSDFFEHRRLVDIRVIRN